MSSTPCLSGSLWIHPQDPAWILRSKDPSPKGILDPCRLKNVPQSPLSSRWHWNPECWPLGPADICGFQFCSFLLTYSFTPANLGCITVPRNSQQPSHPGHGPQRLFGPQTGLPSPTHSMAQPITTSILKLPQGSPARSCFFLLWASLGFFIFFNGVYILQDLYFATDGKGWVGRQI